MPKHLQATIHTKHPFVRGSIHVTNIWNVWVSTNTILIDAKSDCGSIVVGIHCNKAHTACFAADACGRCTIAKTRLPNRSNRRCIIALPKHALLFPQPKLLLTTANVCLVGSVLSNWSVAEAPTLIGKLNTAATTPMCILNKTTEYHQFWLWKHVNSFLLVLTMISYVIILHFSVDSIPVAIDSYPTYKLVIRHDISKVKFS